MSSNRSATLAELRDCIDRIGSVGSRDRTVLPFHIPEIDGRLPKSGLAVGALHEVAGGANGAVDGAAAIAFAAGIAARTGGKVLWCFSQPDVFPPALAQAGLSEDRVVFFEAPDDDTILGGCELALRHGGLTAVVGEVAKLSRVSSQRLQMAAETTGTMAIAVRRWKRQIDARDFGTPTAAYTRWRVTEANSFALPVRGVGPARWFLELMRCRGGDCAEFEVEACNGQGFIRLSSDVADRSPAPGEWRRTAS